MEKEGLIFDIKRDCHDDGPGIRTTVFFKGCPLSCVWCHNPEGKDPEPGLSFNEKACRSPECGNPCLSQCKSGSLQKGCPIYVDYSSCTRCGNCFHACPTNALEPVGQWIKRDDLLYEVSLDRTFYASTGGGVTLSGGEPTMQMEFISCFLKALKDEGIHTVIETSGFFNYTQFSVHVLPFLDLIYFDLKLIDDADSRKYTGRSNRKILENFSRLVRDVSIPVIPRIPLIPEITATKKNLIGIAGFLKKQGIFNCTLMPYNPLWYDKLTRLGISTDYQYRPLMNKEEERVCTEYLFQSA